MEKVSYAAADLVTDGELGLGTWDAVAHYDDVAVTEYTPPPTATLPVTEDFDDGVADFFEARSGSWTVAAERYRVVPETDADGVSTLRIADPLPADVEIAAVINADDVTLRSIE